MDGTRNGRERPPATRGTARAATGSKQSDAIALLKKDHEQIGSLFSRYEQLGERAVKTRGALIDKMITELSVHAAVEEQIVYPAIATEVADGRMLADDAIEDHQEVKELLARIDDLDPGDAECDRLMRRLIDEVREHVQDEEMSLFPKMRAVMDADELRRMGEVIRMAKRTAPTRPHPHAPSKPPANVIVGLATGMADRIRDAARRSTDG